MKRWQSVALMLVAGCMLAWLGVVAVGIASALPWPPRLSSLSKEHPVAVHYSATVVLHFMPMFLVSLASGLALFRVTGTGLPSLCAVLMPYVLLAWLLGVGDRLLHPVSAFSFGLTAISVSTIPWGLLIAWLLSRGRPLSLPSSGRPPAGFAV